jgi:hypothetical protein
VKAYSFSTIWAIERSSTSQLSLMYPFVNTSRMEVVSTFFEEADELKFRLFVEIQSWRQIFF